MLAQSAVELGEIGLEAVNLPPQFTAQISLDAAQFAVQFATQATYLQAQLFHILAAEQDASQNQEDGHHKTPYLNP